MTIQHRTFQKPTIASTGHRTQLVGEPEPWMFEGVCGQIDPEIFFPDKGGSARLAKNACDQCPVREQCLNYALTHDEDFGVWGGYTEQERRRLKKNGTPYDTSRRVRTCRLGGCENTIPPELNGNARYCSRAHAAEAARRRYLSRQDGGAA